MKEAKYIRSRSVRDRMGLRILCVCLVLLAAMQGADTVMSGLAYREIREIAAVRQENCAEASDSIAYRGAYVGATGVLSWPTAGDRIADLESGEGHPGVDIFCTPLADITAADGGEIVFAGETERGGKTVIIMHGENCYTLYEFCYLLNVYAGEKVNKGESIAKVGYGSAADPVHCHFCLWLDGSFIDPSYSIARAIPPSIIPGELQKTAELFPL